MSLIAAAVLILANGPVDAVTAPDPEYDIGYTELVSGQDREAITAIENCDTLAQDDPARLINHAIALARVGEYEAARERFEAAARAEDRYRLETASGEWVDLRVLARRGLAMLSSGEFDRYVALTMR